MKRTKSLIDTPLRLPIGFENAPANPIPKQDIPPTPTGRVALQRQHMKIHSTPIGKVSLQATPAQTPDKISVEPVSLAKQEIGVGGLGVERVPLAHTPLPSGLGHLKPIKRATRPGSLAGGPRAVDAGRIAVAMKPVRTRTARVGQGTVKRATAGKLESVQPRSRRLGSLFY